MKIKISLPVYILMISLILSLPTLLSYAGLEIGKSEKAMREENLAPEGWYQLEAVGESMAAFLNVEEEEQDWDLKLYVNRGASGWFFRYGGSVGDPYDNVYQKTLEGNGEYVLYSLNRLGVARIEIIKDDDAQETLEITPGAPFLLVADRGWILTLYNQDGQEIQPVEESM